MTETYQKHIYEINVEYCSKTIIERIQNEVKDAVKQSHFISLFEFATNEFLKSRNLPEGLSSIRQEQHSIIKTDHDDFYMWLAYFLTIQNPKTIPLILEAYKEQRFGPTANFGNTIEFLVYGLMSHVPFEHSDQERAVMKWIMGSNYSSNPVRDLYEFCQDEKIISNIIIKEEWQNRLKTIFSPYLNSKEDRPKFIKAMEGRHLIPGNEVTLNLKANVFCDVIRKIHEKGYLITSRKNKISEWICTNFQFDKKGEIAKIKATYCVQLLSGREAPNQKDTLVIDFSDRQSTVYQ